MREYLTFAEYQAFGGARNEAEFARLAFKAQRMIDYMTDGRLKGDPSVSETVKRLVFELISLIGNADAAGDGYVPAATSESNDGYSISYADKTILTPEMTHTIARALIHEWLANERNAAGEALLCCWA